MRACHHPADVERNELRNEFRAKIIEAMDTLKNASKLLPSERAVLARKLMAMPSISGQGITRKSVLSTGEIRIEINAIELASRMMRLNESLEVAMEATSEKPRRHADRGGWAPLRMPTPGRRSGAVRNSL